MAKVLPESVESLVVQTPHLVNSRGKRLSKSEEVDAAAHLLGQDMLSRQDIVLRDHNTIQQAFG